MSATLLAVLAAAWKPLAALGVGIAALLAAFLRGRAAAERDTAQADYSTLKRMHEATDAVPPTADPDADRRAVRELSERLRRGHE